MREGKLGPRADAKSCPELPHQGLARRRMRLETRSLSRESVGKFKMRMPEATIFDFTNGVTWIRGIKSDLEIAVMQEAADIADAGMLRAKEVIRPGVREAEAAAEFIASLVRC